MHPAVHKVDWPRPGPKYQLALSKSKSQLTTFFSKSLRIPALHFWEWPHSHPQFLFPIWGFYWDICDCHILPVSAWTSALMSVPTHALSRKVLSLNKTKDKIYKTKNDNIKKNPSAIIQQCNRQKLANTRYSQIITTLYLRYIDRNRQAEDIDDCGNLGWNIALFIPYQTWRASQYK